MKKGKVGFENKGLVILLGVLGVMIVGLVVGIVVVNVQGGGEDVMVDESGQIIDEYSEDEIEEDYVRPALEEYMAEMEEKISLAKTDEEKAELYLSRAGELYLRQQLEEGDFSGMILADVYMAESIKPTIDTAYDIYVYEDEFGDIEKAEQYLKLAEERGLTYDGGKG